MNEALKSVELLKTATHALETPGDFTAEELELLKGDLGRFLAHQE